MAGDVIELGDAEFQREVLESNEPVLVDFTATWCPPCRVLAPVIDSLAAEYKGRMKMAKLNVDDHPRTPEQYGIRAMPTLLFFKGGKVVKQVVGAVPRAKLEEAVRQVL
ncbi:thioredoxin [Corallococcus interemptor]|uniref:Thioredoxin n=2 Tax=Corallococcus coralloides TaxID=184914 RepID=H8MJR9_CORCM|nr:MULTISPECIES: thioredoxin [Corallococcus]AFE10559.1 thioredoxin [Corallococcus coralloides DSM 2259]MBN8466146.1 thioredoxin [Corallococcus exiguus]MBZ4331085.1 thioredoxin [Corallococcus sp. AS-1-12]MBZ4370563.1 thioredoxin [Corallococcus sp. AS-1-6]NOJ97908.1 thioredoxin [Corallococcus coralloides]